MKKYVLLVITVLLLPIGCASRHYYTVEENTVRICLKKNDARVVYFVSSLNGFEPVMAKENGDETWDVTVPKDVEFSYFYIVDGVVYVPLCAFKENDDLGSENCIYVPSM
ncbi:MAG TPA: hypothetical protein VMW78_04160 [Anaerolineae bacterium]|nr:hypothetical protein [Anaerolineae bacterium]